MKPQGQDEETTVIPKDEPLLKTDHLAATRVVLSIQGVWPMERTVISYVKNVVVLASVLCHCYFACLYLRSIWGDYNKVIRTMLNLRGSTFSPAIQILMRFHPQVRKFIEIVTACNTESGFLSTAEKKAYDAIMRKGVNWQRVELFFLISLMGLMMVKPILQLPAAFKDPANATKHISPMFPVLFTYRDNGYLYFAFYVTQCITWYIYICGPICNSFTMLLLTHAAGQCAVLSQRFKNLGCGPHNVKTDFARIVEHHIGVKKFAKRIVDLLGVITLFEVFSSIAGMVVTLHRVITSDDSITGAFTYVFFFFYFGAFVMHLFGYNYSAQNLLNACEDYREAMYMVEWNAMPKSVKRSIIICMLNAEEPIQFKIGGFYNFSYAAFATLTKNALGYVSALSAMV